MGILNLLSAMTTEATLNVIYAILFLILSYLIGSIPFGLVIGKSICHIDIREHGSKNIGSTNAIRVLGKKVGFLVFFFDVFKGMIVILLLRLLDSTGAYHLPAELDYIYFGVAAILGHSFPIYLGFKGGKAVATSLGVVFVTCPIAAIACLIVFYLTLKISGYVSLSSTFATITVLVTTWIFFGVGVVPTNFGEFLIGNQHIVTCILFSLIAVLIIVKHIKNYVRIFNGTENSFKKKKKIETAQAEEK